MKLKDYALHLLWVAAAALVIGCQGEGSDGNGTNGLNAGFTNGGATNGLTAGGDNTGGLNGGLNGGNNGGQDGGLDGGGNGGNGGGLGEFNITFSNVSEANANTDPFTNPIAPTGSFQGNRNSFSGNAQVFAGLGFRSFQVSINNEGIQINQGGEFDANGSGALITYSETDFTGGTRTWRSTDGTVTITSIANGSMTIQLAGVTMTPQAAPAAGTFDLGGPATFIVSNNP